MGPPLNYNRQRILFEKTGERLEIGIWWTGGLRAILLI